ncbi:phosphotransferase [Ornithinibacillus bavariensis]|uniref:phosphotransferase n=1 Tax=Ornithinibacillus bavariensis TaxID=545502 RepID=UPI003D1CEB79
MDWIGKVLDKEWDIMPAGGLTGEAFVARKGSKQLFLKRNSSPFLAVLSAGGFVPKLVWTKRLDNGDVVTAQKWLPGRELRPAEMQHNRVADLIHKIHHSAELFSMLLRLGKKPKTAEDHFQTIRQRLLTNQLEGFSIEIREGIDNLYKHLDVTRQQRLTVCHGDINHHNLLLTDTDELYLIDWDQTMIADPIADYGMILNSYIPKENWNNWLKRYGITLNRQFIIRMYWYLIADSLAFLSFHFERDEKDKFEERLEKLQDLNMQMKLL